MVYVYLNNKKSTFARGRIVGIPDPLKHGQDVILSLKSLLGVSHCSTLRGERLEEGGVPSRKSLAAEVVSSHKKSKGKIKMSSMCDSHYPYKDVQ